MPLAFFLGFLQLLICGIAYFGHFIDLESDIMILTLLSNFFHLAQCFQVLTSVAASMRNSFIFVAECI